MFDFSRFIGGEKTRPIEFIGLTSQQNRCSQRANLWSLQRLLGHYPDVTKRGNGPNSTTRVRDCLGSGRRYTYAEIANAMDISEDSAYQAMNKFREIEAAFALKIEL